LFSIKSREEKLQWLVNVILQSSLERNISFQIEDLHPISGVDFDAISIPNILFGLVQLFAYSSVIIKQQSSVVHQFNHSFLKSS